MRRERPGALSATIVAVAFHAAALAAIGNYRQPTSRSAAPPPTTADEPAQEPWIAVEEAASTPLASELPAAEPVKVASAWRALPHGRGVAARTEAATETPLQHVGSASVDDAPAAWSPSFLRPAPPLAGDLTRSAAWQGATLHDESDKAAEWNLRASVDASDRALGLSAGSPLKSLAHESVRQSNAPSTGRARIEVRTDREGVVIAARVLDASGDRTGWEDAARAIAEAAHGRRLHVPPGASGLSVTLDVASYMTTASGVSRGQSSLHVASPMGTGNVGESPAPQPLRFNVIVGPNQVDARVHLGVGDIAHDATQPDRRTITVDIAEERRL